ncbi:MAG: transketolase [Candidatus Margulisiibacteriota bacterium]
MLKALIDKADWVRRETLKIHAIAPETRVASSLSCIEVLTCLYYGKVLAFDPSDINWSERDRFIISKAHGSISLYPILADLGFIGREELSKVCQQEARLGCIPDMLIPGYETINGSLGHGLGVACGIALALKRQNRSEKTFVLMGDGELYEGSVWEAVMFAGEHKADNLILIIDRNKACMLDFCDKIIDLEPLETKFEAFKWQVKRVDGHDIAAVNEALLGLKNSGDHRPKVLIADTTKGKGVPSLESDALSHMRVLKKEEIYSLLGE